MNIYVQRSQLGDQTVNPYLAYVHSIGGDHADAMGLLMWGGLGMMGEFDQGSWKDGNM